MEIKKLNRAEAFRYMGHKGGKINENLLKLTEQCEQELLKAIKPRYIYKIFNIEQSDEYIQLSNTTLTLKGKDISAHLQNCDRCILLCATLSSDTDKLIRTHEAEGMEKALITDSLASAAVEQVCEAAETEIQSALPDNFFTWRFSPGYGDFPLEIQGEFLDTLNAPKRIGVTVTDSLILIPRKSVTAVIGVSKTEIPKGQRSCGTCNMKDTCPYRKNYGHCN